MHSSINYLGASQPVLPIFQRNDTFSSFAFLPDVILNKQLFLYHMKRVMKWCLSNEMTLTSSLLSGFWICQRKNTFSLTSCVKVCSFLKGYIYWQSWERFRCFLKWRSAFPKFFMYLGMGTFLTSKDYRHTTYLSSYYLSNYFCDWKWQTNLITSLTKIYTVLTRQFLCIWWTDDIIEPSLYSQTSTAHFYYAFQSLFSYDILHNL